MKKSLNYRLALDLGTTSLGWALIRLNAQNQPIAMIKAGVRIFSDGRNPKDGSSLAVTRRDARAMRRRRDRLLKRKERMMNALVKHGFFPNDTAERKALERLNPYELRAKGLNEALTSAEFARALFHINQRRGFKSNRKTDKADNEAGALKTAISELRQKLRDEDCRTVGEWLYRQMLAGKSVRARFHQRRITKDDGKTKIEKSYDLYIDRQMVENEFDALWAKQSALNPQVFSEAAHAELKDVLLFQRNLRPVKAGRCTLLPDEERAPLALPSVQRMRMYQEVNHLRILGAQLSENVLTLPQRNELIHALERHSKRTFTQIKKLLNLSGATQFNFEDPKRQELKGNTTSAILSGDKYFGKAWFDFDECLQDKIVWKLLKTEKESWLITWLMSKTGVDEVTAERIANAKLPDGYGNFSYKATARILPELYKAVTTYDKAVVNAGFEHHSQLQIQTSAEQGDWVEKIIASTGEVKQLFRFHELPYYGEPLQRFVGFGSGNPDDAPEKRWGKIANPTVHVGLNQVRTVVNALIKRYGHPAEVIVEVARELKQSKAQRDEENKRQAQNQRRNERIRTEIAQAKFGGNEYLVKHADIQKWILWEELSFDPIKRLCPYSGRPISAEMLLTDQVEIEHILPFSITLDDSLNNKTVALRSANRDKGNRTPWQAFGERTIEGYDYQAILLRAELMSKRKGYRFGKDGYAQWLKEDKDFLARALNDTRYLSRVAKEYLLLICPQNTRVIPGLMTAKMRANFGLNNILGLDGLKNREDHRHHAVDACVIGVTDQGLLQRFANASASTREKQLDKLVERMPDPWVHYRDHVQRAIGNIYVSHRPDHGYEGAMHEETAWGLRGDGVVFRRVRNEDGHREPDKKNLNVIPFNSTRDPQRHGVDENGQVKAYKGYVGGSNYCIDIVRNDKGKWEGEVVSTYTAYQLIRELGKAKGEKRLYSKTLSISGKPLVMRLQIGDTVRMKVDDRVCLMRLVSAKSSGEMLFAEHNEANVDARNRDRENTYSYTSKRSGSLQKTQARKVMVSSIGEVKDLGFQE